jgi:hypothetical protein
MALTAAARGRTHLGDGIGEGLAVNGDADQAGGGEGQVGGNGLGRAVHKVLKCGPHGGHPASSIGSASNGAAGGHGALAQLSVGVDANCVSPDAGHVGASRGEGGEGDGAVAGQVDLDAGQALGKRVSSQAGGVYKVQLEVACRRAREARVWMAGRCQSVGKGREWWQQWREHAQAHEDARIIEQVLTSCAGSGRGADCPCHCQQAEGQGGAAVGGCAALSAHVSFDDVKQNLQDKQD